MKVKSIKEVYEIAERGELGEVYLGGWVRTSRLSKAIGFIELFDGTIQKTIQIVFDDKLENFEEISKITIGSCLKILGDIVLSPNEQQKYEIQAKKIEVEGLADQSYPLQKKRHSYEYLRTLPHLRARTNLFSAIFRVRSVLNYAIHKYLNENGFVYVPTPCITTSDCEGAGEVFKITTVDFDNLPLNEEKKFDYSQDFFGKPAYMTVSGQLNVEPFAMAYRKVYTFGPCFRAENSNTTRHVAEFWQVEPEMAFADLDDLIETIEGLSKYIIKYVLDNCKLELELFDKFIEPGLIAKLENVANSNFARVSYKEAMELLKKSGKEFSVPVDVEGGIQTEHERYLADEYYKKPVFVTDYPKGIKAFYMKVNDDGETVAATDLLFPGLGEIVGASEREARYDVLVNRIKEMGLNPEDYAWYTDLRRYGTCTHSGFGLGLERMMRFITGMENIRDVIPYPRAPKYAEF